MKDWIYKLIHPKSIVVLMGALLIIVSLAYLICLDKFGTPLSYVLYLLMTYALVIIVVKLCEVIKGKINKIIDSNKYLARYKSDYMLRHRVSLYLSLVWNVLYVMFKIISGIVYKSIWFISFALYYLLIVIVKTNIVKEDLNHNTSLKDEYLKYRSCGVIMLFMNVVLTCIILIVVKQNIEIVYHVYIVIAMAVYTFGIMVTSIATLVKYKKYKSPLISATKILNVVRSLMAMLSLEVVMLSTFGTGRVMYNQIMVMATGGGISLIIFVICICMIIKANNWLKKNA